MDQKDKKLLELYRTISFQLTHFIETNQLTHKMIPNQFHWLKASLQEVNDLEKRKESMYPLNDLEIYTIIEGLRSLQRHDCGDQDILNDSAIDSLCVDLNC